MKKKTAYKSILNFSDPALDMDFGFWTLILTYIRSVYLLAYRRDNCIIRQRNRANHKQKLVPERLIY